MCALQCSSTCAGGFQRRVVVCQDADGRSNSYCDERVKPAESKSCDSGPCPLWNYGVWGEVRLYYIIYLTAVFGISFHLLIVHIITFPIHLFCYILIICCVFSVSAVSLLSLIIHKQASLCLISI